MHTNTVKDYIAWWGEIPFERMPWNEVDAYLIAKIGSPDLGGIVPENEEGISLADAYGRYFSRTDIDPTYFGRLVPSLQVTNLKALASTARYKDVLLSDYFHQYSEEGAEQVSALTVTLPDGTTFVTFRGTDDTIIGWKENFFLAVHTPVAAQRDALGYLIRMAQLHPGKLILSGHSKGGNLAVYAAVNAPEEIRARITQVINFDGPGFHADFWETDPVKEMSGRMTNYMSQHALVGTLMYHGGETVLCRSTRSGPLAHEAMFWEVTGASFTHETKLEPSSVEFGRLINAQTESMTDEEIIRVVEDIFGILTRNGATTLTQLVRQKPDEILKMAGSIVGTDSVKSLMKQLLRIFFEGELPLILSLKSRRTDGETNKPEK